MHAPTGDLYKEKMGKMFDEQGVEAPKKFLKQMVPISKKTYGELLPLGRNTRKGNMRNKPCVCGSGVKFKRCCWSKYD